ncbi:alpha/beta hydrolase fold domain-containing protein [Nonomuraea aridisoli]|uniref:Alpha/beta hydrolase n=1 Tax=Nonomuraea aridisoli TaxID=2070368 RepID=A0A2W2F329_9ACTN|nr:alpha/beta hydrolase [Nonomuraea aridisoli]PZG19388.1 alpha/beta hydrolase [Nonomuraea aridisoli]
MSEISVVVGPGVPADAALLAEIATRELAVWHARGAVAYARDAAHLRSLVRGSGAAVVVPGPSPEARALIGQPLGSQVVAWVDLEHVEGAGHIHGRGLWGLAWGVRHAVHRLRHPPTRRVLYGDGSAEQWADLYLPPGRTDRTGRTGRTGGTPVVALVHGGYWRSIWAADLMEALCADLTARGLAVWNLEYRRPDRHGWAATVADVAAGLAAMEGADPGLDLDRIALAGHSAGAQLVLRAVADGARARLAVSLAGVLDLVQADRRRLSAGATAAALGRPSPDTAGLGGAAAGDPGRTPEESSGHGAAAPDDVYAAASPLHRVPVGVPQLIVQGTGDELDFVDFGRRYARAAREAGDDVTYLEMPGGHFDVILPTTPIWQATAQAITDALA